MPYADAVTLADVAGLDRFIDPKFGMEVTAGGMVGLCCQVQTAEWWDAWRESAEKIWRWNASYCNRTVPRTTLPAPANSAS